MSDYWDIQAGKALNLQVVTSSVSYKPIPWENMTVL